MPEKQSSAKGDKGDVGDQHAEIARLNKIIQALMNRAERSTNLEGSDFSLFQTAVMLEEQVRARTQELEAALGDNERITRTLRESEARYRTLFNAIDEGFCVIEVIFDEREKPIDYRFLEVSASFEKQTGLVNAQGRRMRELAPRHEDHWFEIYGRIALTGEPARFQNRAEELHRWFDVYAFRFGEPEDHQVAILFNDISERLAAEEALRKSEAKFAAMFSLTPDPMALTRLSDGILLEVSRSYAEFFGYRPEEMIGRSTLPGDLGLWIDAGQRQRWKDLVTRDGAALGTETALRRKDGSIVSVLISGKLVDMAGEQCVIVDIRDITEQKQHAEYLERIAQHDPLTGLPNRLLLGDRLRQAIVQYERTGTRIAVCYVDLDGFKEVNDRFGHQAGDQLLIEFANRLVATVRRGDTVARLGGDEFVILLLDLADDEECRIALDRLLQASAAPYTVGDSEHAGISASIGVTLFPSDPVDPDTLVRHADHAMYAAKQAGKNRYQMFDTRLEQRIVARHATLRGLAAALEAGQFRLYYQPKVDCQAGQIVGAEALIRWEHPTLGLLSPAEFVPLIEDTDLALDVGEWVFREALAQIVRWRREGIALCVSVNAFIRQLVQPGFSASLAGLLEEFAEVEPDCLQIEIVETAALKQLNSIRQVIEDCRKLGVTFSLDDFGTGYSTLAHLRHLPATEIKIDQSFVGKMLTQPEDLAIVEAVIGLARVFNRSAVAEGAETPDHITRLVALGCSVIQGYALARPMAADDIPRWVREFRPDPAWQSRRKQ